MTDAVIESVEEALNNRELLKVRVLENAPLDVEAAADAVAARIPNAHVPQTIGRIFVLYRPFPAAPEIRLPEA